MRAPLDLAALADHLDALGRAAQLVAQDLRSGVAGFGSGGPHGPEKCMATRSDLLEASEVAERLRINVRTLRRWREEGRVPNPLRGKGPLRWSRDAIERWIEERQP